MSLSFNEREIIDDLSAVLLPRSKPIEIDVRFFAQLSHVDHKNAVAHGALRDGIQNMRNVAGSKGSFK